MKCKICGSECPPDAKICRDCAAARKRAFAVTVTQPLLAGVGVPSVGTPRFAPKPPRPRPPPAAAVEREASRSEPAPALPLNVVPKSLGVHWLLIGVAVAATIVVLVVKMLSADNGRAAEDTGAVAPSAPPTAAAAAPPLIPAEPRVTQETPATATPVNDLPSPKRAPDKRSQRKSRPRAEPARPVVALPPPPPEPAPVAREPAPPPRAVATPRPDPWQVMNEGLSRCASEDLLSRAACEQRLRLQYCPNYWGLVWQCPIGPTTDHGQ
jgi:hypothetical protein